MRGTKTTFRRYIAFKARTVQGWASFTAFQISHFASKSSHLGQRIWRLWKVLAAKRENHVNEAGKGNKSRVRNTSTHRRQTRNKAVPEFWASIPAVKCLRESNKLLINSHYLGTLLGEYRPRSFWYGTRSARSVPERPRAAIFSQCGPCARLRILPAFAGALRKKILTRASLKKTQPSYIWVESLINALTEVNACNELGNWISFS